MNDFLMFNELSVFISKFENDPRLLKTKLEKTEKHQENEGNDEEFN
jgi:hypothetical protein